MSLVKYTLTMYLHNPKIPASKTIKLLFSESYCELVIPVKKLVCFSNSLILI